MISYPPGTPSWVDVASPDVDATKRFYGELFGWEATAVTEDPEQSGNYHTFSLDGKNVGGVGAAMQGMPPVWNVYIAVEDAAAIPEKVDAAGGQTVVQPMEVFTAGTLAVFTDPGGAFFCIWQAGDNKGAEIVNAVGAFTMAELDTRDRQASEKFYAKVFGWKYDPMEVDGEVQYLSVKLDGRLVAGLLPMGDDFPAEVPNHWRPYFGVEDLEASSAKVKELGGQVLTEPMDVPEGKFVAVIDNHGASFSLWQGSYDPPPGG